MEEKRPKDDQEEEIELVDGDNEIAAKIARLKKDLAVCRDEKDEYLKGWQRAKADFINGQRQYEREDAERARFLKKLAVKDLLDIIDNFEKAFLLEVPHIPWAEGIRRMYDKCLKLLDEYGITAMESIGKTFNPQYHEAIETRETEDPNEDGVVVEEFQKGYQMQDEVIRPSRVKVAKLKDK